MKVAYDYEFETHEKVDTLLKEELLQSVQEWNRRHQSEHTPFLFFTKSMEFVTIYDGRGDGQPTKTRFEGVTAQIISFCNDHPRSHKQIETHTQELLGTNPEDDHLETILSDLTQKRILFEERGKYLTLALAQNSNL